MLTAENGPRPATPPPALVAESELKNPYDRQSVNPRKYAALLESVRANGILEPLQVSANGNVLSGNCRLRAARELGLTHVPAVMRPDAATEAEELRFVFACDEKSDRDPLDTARLLEEFRTRHGMTSEQAAAAVGVSPATVSRLKKYSDAPPDLRAAHAAGQISFTALVEVMRHPPERRPEVLLRAVEGKLDAAAIRALNKPKKGVRKARPVSVSLGGVRLEVPADMTPEALMNLLRVGLFAACSKAAAINLGVESLPRIVAAQK